MVLPLYILGPRGRGLCVETPCVQSFLSVSEGWRFVQVFTSSIALPTLGCFGHAAAKCDAIKVTPTECATGSLSFAAPSLNTVDFKRLPPTLPFEKVCIPHV